MSEDETCYREIASRDVPIAGYSPLFGSMLTGSAFHCASAALMLMRQTLYACPVQDNPHGIRVCTSTEARNLEVIQCVKLQLSPGEGRDRAQTMRPAIRPAALRSLLSRFQLFAHREPYLLGELSNDPSLEPVSVGRLDGIEVANLHRMSSQRLEDQASRREDPVETVGHHGLDWQLILDCHSKGPVMKISDLSCPGSTPLRIEEECSTTIQSLLNALRAYGPGERARRCQRERTARASGRSARSVRGTCIPVPDR